MLQHVKLTLSSVKVKESSFKLSVAGALTLRAAGKSETDKFLRDSSLIPNYNMEWAHLRGQFYMHDPHSKKFQTY